MGNESSAAAAAPASAASLTANTANMTTKNPTTYTLSAVPTTPVTTMTTMTTKNPTTYTLSAVPTTPVTTMATMTTPITTTAAATATTTTTTTTAPTTTHSPTPAITSTATNSKETPKTTVAPIESTSTPTFYSIVKSVTSETAKAKSASSTYSHWYKWSKFEKQNREKGKIPWYMSPTSTTTITSSPTTSTLTTTIAKIDEDRKEVSDPSDIIALPSFSLRSTAVYSPPHGDRIPSGRNELINTDTSIFKYYLPENRSKRMAGIHTKATMYKMNTLSRQIPLPTHPSQLSATNPIATTNPTRNSASLPTFVSRGQQASLEAQPTDSTQVRYYEKQPSQLISVSGVSNYRPSNVGFYHLSAKDTNSQPFLPSLEKPPILLNDPPRSSTIQSFPPNPLPPPRPQPRPSILKNSSTVLSQDMSNPLSEQTHNKVLEELRRQNQNTKDGVYRVKKVHLLEKTEPEPRPAPASFTRPVRRPSSKASQSILRSEKLLFSDLFNRKK